MATRSQCSWFVMAIAMISLTGAAQDSPRSPIRLYIDADFRNARESSLAIQRGIQTALDLAGNRLGDAQVEVVVKNHQSNCRRSQRNLQIWQQDPRALCVFAGIHSLPLIQQRDWINRERILVFAPWSAATSITRATGPENWIFRLSLDDSKVGKFLIDGASSRGLERPFLLLVDHGWGEANLRTMSRALSENGREPVGVARFSRGLSAPVATMVAQRVARSGADHIVYVGVQQEFCALAAALGAMQGTSRLPIYSHWGILGGDLRRAMSSLQTPPDQILVVRTPFRMFQPSSSPLALRAASRVKQLFPNFEFGPGLPAEPAFIHAFDLTQILIEACKPMKLAEDPKAQLMALRARVERLDGPIEGLLHTYRRPFGPWKSGGDRDAHEALSERDFVLGRVLPDGRVVPETTQAAPREER